MKLKWKLEVFLIVLIIKVFVNRDSVRVFFIVLLNKKNEIEGFFLGKFLFEKKLLLGYCYGKLLSCFGELYKWIKLFDSNKMFRLWFFIF